MQIEILVFSACTPVHHLMYPGGMGISLGRRTPAVRPVSTLGVRVSGMTLSAGSSKQACGDPKGESSSSFLPESSLPQSLFCVGRCREMLVGVWVVSDSPLGLCQVSVY